MTMNFAGPERKLSLGFCSRYICTNKEFNLVADTISMSYLTTLTANIDLSPSQVGRCITVTQSNLLLQSELTVF